MDDFVEIRLWGEQRLDFLRRFLPYERGLPSHDTLNDVFNALDPELFEACFVEWVAALRDNAPDVIAIDGKTSRRCHARAKGRGPLHLVSAWAARQRLVLAQEAVDEKSNEIVAIPLLLERLELAGALVTIDAMGTQAAIAEKIVARGGDYLLALKANRPSLQKEVEAFFADPPPNLLKEPFETTDNDHGRVERRRHLVCHDVGWLFSDRRYAGEPRFPHLAMIGMIETSNATAPRRRSVVTISPRRRSTPKPSPPRRGPIGASRTGSTGCSTSSSTTTSSACEADTARKTWPSSGAWP
jgi:predicted transposase YbfD/YdcC